MAILAAFTLAAPWAEGAIAQGVAAFPAPRRPVADIVSPTWGDQARRDGAHEVEQIAGRLGIRAGMTVADIGAGSGYDTLRLARVVGPAGRVIGEDVTPTYLRTLKAAAEAAHLKNVTTVLGSPAEPKLPTGAIDAAIMVHMYHEIAQPYALLYNLAAAFRPGGRLGIEELDRPTQNHGTPPALLVCELAAMGYRKMSLAPLQGGLGYFAVFAPPAPGARPAPGRIKPCGG
jgi:SAM-dependent methyltransferase